MNRILTKILFFIFRMNNKGDLTIPQIQLMKKMTPKEKKKYLRELKDGSQRRIKK